MKSIAAISLAVVLASMGVSGLRATEITWRSPCRYRVLLEIDPRRAGRSNSPVSIDLDPSHFLAAEGLAGRFDADTVEVIAHRPDGVAAVFDASRDGYERHLLPVRVESYYGIDRVTVHFALPGEAYSSVAVYFDTVESNLGRSRRYRGLVGDGDFVVEGFHRREIGATHFDTMADLDGDGDLDLFRGGVEPYIHCFENVGGQRLVARGRLTSGGSLLTLPRNRSSHRSWVVPHFHDLDGDGDLDFLPSFMDGPFAGRIVLFENTTSDQGPLTFTLRAPLKTASGVPIAGGEQAGGWFPSIAFMERNERALDLILGNNNHCYYYQGQGRDEAGGWRWSEAVALKAGGAEIELFNPCFELADVDADGDLDLFAAPQSGEIILYRNLGEETLPRFSKGEVLAYGVRYLQRSTHPRVVAADFTGDGKVDFVVDRAWELTDLDRTDERDFGALFENVGTKTEPRWERRGAENGALFTEDFQPCDALRQNVVRAVDWNRDSKVDLLAGDCDGFIWYFERVSDRPPIFASGRKLEAGGATLSLADRSGHARHDVCDWNGDGVADLVVADGAGGVTLFLGSWDDTRRGAPRLAAGRRVEAESSGGALSPIQRGTRAHVMVCDWNSDGRKDLVFSDQDRPGFWVFENKGTDASPRLATARRLPLDSYVRPNLGAFVDWDGDGRRDLIACEFEHSVRLYRNVGDGEPGTEPRFADRVGRFLLKPFAIMMISGADVVDFNGDGDLDLLTGQGHGGSGIRFYERDFIEDASRDSHPVATVRRFEERGTIFLDTVRRYADAMIEHGRDTYGESASGLFLSALDRRRLRPIELRPAPPGGIRRGDRAGLPWLALRGANPHNDENLLRVLYSLADLTGEPRYREVADHEIEWFFKNTGSAVTGLLPWGEHLSWDVQLDRPVSSGTELTHEFARPWVLWRRTFALAPEAAHRFTVGLWKHQIADHRSGAFDRHAPYDRHGPRDGRDFPRHAGFYLHAWAHAYAHRGDAIYLTAIETLIRRFERKRRDGTGAEHSTLGPLDVSTASKLVPEPLAGRLRAFAETEDRLILAELREQFAGDDGTWSFPATWEAGYASGTSLDRALFALARWQQTGDARMRDLVVAIAGAYCDALPAEDVDVWPMTFGHLISTQVAAYRLTRKPVYLAEATRFASMAIELYWQDSPLPRAGLKVDHYETITGADSLALSLLDLHVALSGVRTTVPPNTIDR